jgi:hypothetical protein
MNPFFLQSVLMAGLTALQQVIMEQKFQMPEEQRIVGVPPGLVLPPFPGRGTA